MSAAAIMILLCPAGAAEPREKPCHVDGFETPVSCHFISVPLDYDAMQGTRVTIGAAIVPATTARPAADPLVVLAGGPGQAATGMGPWLGSAFKPAREKRDIILFDIRGTGLSGRIDCTFSLTATAGGIEQGRRDAEACAKRFGESAAFYSVREAVEDLERLRVALGYQRLSLWGGSFGTRIAQHYIRKYGAHVRAAVLDGATPVGESIFATGPVAGQRALDRLFVDCERDAACVTAFPNLPADLELVLARAERGELEFEAPDPSSGIMRSSAIDRDGVVGLVRGALYVGVTRALAPYAIAQGARGDLKPLVTLGAATAEWSAETMALGALLGIICPEDQARARNMKPADLSHGFMQDSYFRYFAEACSVWPYRALPEHMFAPLSSTVSTLVISGEADPVTPPASGAAVLKQFKTRIHVVIPNAFHTNSANPCVARIIASFLDDPQTGGRDHACAKRGVRPRFLTTPNV